MDNSMDNTNSDLGEWRGWSLARPWYRFALKLVPRGQREKVLDLGAGNGEFAAMLAKVGKKVFCADNSSVYIRRLRKKGFKVVLADFNKKLPFKNQAFEGTSCLEVIEHIVRAEQFLKEIKRVLKRRGWLVISTPNISWVGYRFLALSGQPPLKEGYHLRYFNYYSLKEKLKKAGFEVEKEACFSPIPYINRIKQFWLPVKPWPSLLAQDLIFFCRKDD